MDANAADPLIVQPAIDRQSAIDARLECLKLAITIYSGAQAQDAAVKLADQYAAFVLGTAKG